MTAGRKPIALDRGQVLALRRQGLTWDAIANRLGVGAETARRAGGAAERARRHDSQPAPARVRADAERLLRLVPADTRSLTGRLCGDPLPGRSALDRRGPR